MSTNLVQAAVNRSNRNMLLLSSVVALAVFAVVAFQWRYLINFVAGPTTIAPKDVAALNDANDLTRYWVSLTGEDVFDTGVQYVTENDNGTERVDANYMALLVDDRLLVVKTADTTPVMSYSGALVDLPADEQREIVDDFDREYPEYEGAFLPMMLDTSSFRTDGYIWYTVAGVALAACGWGLVTALRRFSDPLKHPFFKRLAAYGQPQAVASEIENEMLAPTASINKVSVTNTWLVSRHRGFHAARLQDIVWVYRHVTKTKYYGVITVRTDHAVHVWDRFGQKIEVQLKEKQANELIELVVQHAPWAIAGYTDELQQVWSKQRADLIVAVDERRQQALGGMMALEPSAA